nr:MASE1 domain-containing protein [Pseudoruegeria sp. HB172150]
MAHGLTALVITPVQSHYFPEITGFASLAYLPHGVRVLATWLVARKAFFPLYLGAFVSELLFTPDEFSHATDPIILLSIAVGAVSAVLAFELICLFGRNLYAGRTPRVHWRWLLLAGTVASLINSIGQSIVFSGRIGLGDSIIVLVTYAIGDIIGLVISTLILMLVFRWIRLLTQRD